MGKACRRKKKIYFFLYLLLIHLQNLAESFIISRKGSREKMKIEKMKKEKLNSEEAVIEREKKQYVKMTQTPMGRLIISLGIPTTISMMITSLYNLADTYFVSRIGDDAITAAASNLLALMSIIQAIGFTFGMGSGNIISRLLGKRDRESADKVGSSALTIACL